MRYIKGVYGRALAPAWSTAQSGRWFSSGIKPGRKAMVEAFVKKYQQSNNGRFPTLALTRKEVGGGYYSVRYILQELKFAWSRNQGSQLAPADKFPPGTNSEHSVSSASNGTVSVPDKQPRSYRGKRHPISDGIGAASRQKHLENPQKFAEDLINAENVGCNEAARVLASGSSDVEQLASIVVEGPQLAPAYKLPQGTRSKQPRSSMSSASNGTVSVPDKQPGSYVGKLHPISDGIGAASKQKHLENLHQFDGDLINVENTDCNKVAAKVLAGGSSNTEQLADIVVEGHPSVGKSFDAKNDTEIQDAGGSLKNMKHASEVSNEVASAPSVERKAMVESFVKKYQQSNNGRFPSIKLTREEVGGSHYAVRHILQELKVVWSQNQGLQLAPADNFSQGTRSKQPRSSVSSASNGTVSVPDKQPKTYRGKRHTISDGIGAASKQKHLENLQKFDGDLINVENVDCNEAKVAGGALASGSSNVEQLAGTVVEGHPSRGKSFNTRNDTEIQGGGGSLENTKHANEVPNEAASTPSLEIRESVEEIEAIGSMKIERIVEAGTSEGIVVPNENASVEAFEIQGGGGSLENRKHAKEVPNEPATPSLEIRESFEQVEASGSMKIERIVEAGTSEGIVVPNDNASVGTSDSKPSTVPTDVREEKVESEPRNQGLSSDKGGSLDQSCIRSGDKVRIVADGVTTKTLNGTSARQLEHQQTGMPDNVQQKRDMSVQERPLAVAPEQKSIGAAFKSFVVNAFRKFWPG